MKDYNFDHDVLIESRAMLADSSVEPKAGEIMPHKKIVDRIIFYENGHKRTSRIILTKAFILDIAQQIKDLEDFTFAHEVQEDLPF